MFRRSKAPTAYAAVCAILVVLAVNARGETTRHVELDDGGVWVTHGEDGRLGRFNKSIAQLDAVLVSPEASKDLDVLQDADAVVAWDRGAGTLTAVDVAQRALSGEPTVVSPASAAGLGGGSLAVLNEKNELRAARVSDGTVDVAQVGPAAQPLLKVEGARATLAVGRDGAVHVAHAGGMFTVRPAGTGFGKPSRSALPDIGKIELTAVGAVPVVLDAAAGRVVLPASAKSVTLPGSRNARLQQPGPQDENVAIADDTGLWLVPLDGGAPRRVSEEGTQRATAPVRVGRCVHAAWHGGQTAYVRACGGAAEPAQRFTPLAGGAPVFRVNRGRVVLNDTVTGWVMLVDDTLQPLKQLWDTVRPADSPDDDDIPPVDAIPHVREDRPPRANDDTFGARPDRATVLHVLDNDTDPEGDLLVISAVTKPDVEGATAVVSPDGQTLVVTVPSGTVDTVHVRYTADDGYGKSDSATVAVEPRGGDKNAAPVPRREFTATAYSVAPGATLRLPALSDWRDFDGDPLLVTRERARAGSLSAMPDGTLLLTAPSTPGKTELAYAVTDGIAKEATAARKISVTVLDPASARPFASPVARPDAVRVMVGMPAVVEPLANDVPGADATDPQTRLTLARDVATKPGLEVVSDVARGRLTVRATKPGAYLLSYSAAFGAAPVSKGLLRVDAYAAKGSSDEPVAMPDSAILRGQRPVVIDVLGNDFDPSGGMLVVQDAVADQDSGLTVSVLDGRALRIVADGAGTQAAASVAYRVTNGPSAPVTGSVAVTMLPADAANAPPIAVNDTAVVRAGDSTAVAVLDNDFDPDGDALGLASLPVTISPSMEGAAAAVSGRFVRFAAPASVTEAQQVTLDYIAEDPSGERSTGRVSVTVTPADAAAGNQPPVPKDVEGRLVAGDTYVARIPVYGVDPDGDSVTVTGVVKPPSLGRVVSSTADSITFQAYPDSVGTDSLSYEVTDAYGQSAQGSVRLGIVAPGALSPPTAVDDQVNAIPGRTVRIDVTQNDLIGAGRDVTVLPLEQVGEVPGGVRLDGRVLAVRVPQAGDDPVVVAYGITDGVDEPSIAHVTVRPQPDAALPPVARDDSPPVDAPGGTVTVDVVANDDDPDGSDDALRVSVFDTRVRVEGTHLVVPVAPQPRQVAYRVTDPDGLSAMAVLRVPGSEAAGPRLKPGARIRVPVGGTVKASLKDLVVTPSGRPVQLTTTDHLAASPTSGVALGADDGTSVSVRGLASYAGPGAISFQVTDGKSLQDEDAQLAQITVPVQVGPDAPALRCPSTPLTVIPGGADLVADVVTVCHLWVDTTVDQPVFSVGARWKANPRDVSLQVRDATKLVLTAASSAKPGKKGVIELSVPGTPVKADLPVVLAAAPKPAVRAVTLNGLRAGRPTTVDLKQFVTSRLREPRLAVARVERATGDPAETKIDGTKVTITPGRDSHGVTVLTAVVTDLPGRPDRFVSVSITATVQGRPARPAGPRVVSVGNGEVVLGWPAPSNNGAPIQRYEVSGAGRAATCFASPCTISRLTNGRTYSFTLTAVNIVGKSDVSPRSAGATPDRVPNAVTGIKTIARDTAASASWRVPGGGGTPVVGYQVEIRPGPRSGAAIRTVASPSVSITSLENGITYQVRVRARNSAKPNGGFGPWSAHAAVVPFGRPPAMASPVAEGADVPDPASSRAIKVSWPAADGNGRAITKYTVAQYVDTSEAGSFATKVAEVSGSPASFGGPGTFSRSFTVSNDGRFYRFTVRATNAGAKESPASPKSNAVQGAAPPAKVTSVRAKDHADGSNAGYNGAVHVVFAVPAPHADRITRVEWLLNGTDGTGQWDAPGAPGTTVELAITGMVNGKAYVVQVRGCNEAALCGPWSEASNQVVPYGPPASPDVTASEDGTWVNYAWGGGGGNGRPISHYVVCIDGNCANRGAGSDSRNYGYSGDWSISVRAVDTVGQVSGATTRSGRTMALPRTITISKGAPKTSTTCTHSSCAHVHVEVRGFTANTTYTIAYFDCRYSPCAQWTSHTFVTNGAGAASFDGNAWYGYPGRQVFVRSNGIESNHFTWY